MNKVKTDFLVIGSGITGLTLSVLLKEKNRDVILVDARNAVGGAIQTKLKDGWILETGPNTILITNTIFSELIEKTGLTSHVLEASDAAKNRYIIKNGRTVALPLSPISFFVSPLFGLRTKLNLIAEPFRSRMKTADETLSDFVVRRLGREFLEYAINPFVAGVYAGSPDALSVRYGFPKLYELEKKHGSLIKGAIKGPGSDRNPIDIPRNKAKMISFTNGNQQFTNALGDLIGEHHLKLNTSVRRIKKMGNESYQVNFNDGSYIDCSHLILTIPAHLLTKIEWINVDETEQLQPISQVTYPEVCVAHFGFKKTQVAHLLDGFGMLVPEVENRFILGALFNSTLFPERAPTQEDCLITVFTGGSRHPEISTLTDTEIIQKAFDDLKILLQIEGNPSITHLKRWGKAIPQYNFGYEKVIHAKSQFEGANRGIYLAGNYTGGISVGDCIKNAWDMSNLLTHN